MFEVESKNATRTRWAYNDAAMTILATARLRLEPCNDNHQQGLHRVNRDPEAAQRMAAFAFDTLKSGLLCAVCHPANTASSGVMKKLGMQYRRNERWYEMDTAVYDMTQADWQARQDGAMTAKN